MRLFPIEGAIVAGALPWSQRNGRRQIRACDDLLTAVRIRRGERGQCFPGHFYFLQNR